MLLFNPFTFDSRVLKEARTLVGAGADVRVLAQTGRGLPDRESIDGIRVVRLPHDPLPARIIRGLVAKAGHAGNGAIDAEAVTLPPRPRPPHGGVAALAYAAETAVRRIIVSASYFRWYRSAVRVAAEEPVDLLVAHDFEALPAAWLAARRLNAAVLYDSHELAADQVQLVPRTAMGQWRMRWTERALARRAAAVVTVNDSIASELVTRYGIARPYVVRNVPYATEPAAADSRWLDQLAVPEQHRVAIYIGGLVPGRGIEDVIEAMRYLDEVTLVLMGPGSDHDIDRFRVLARNAGVSDRIRFAPPVPSRDVPRYAAAADLGIVPARRNSLNDWYSLPNKIFEYLGAGLPVVTVAFPELRRIIEHYDAGATCAPERPAELASAIERLLADPHELSRLGHNAAAAGAALTWEREQDVYLTAIRAALATSS